MSHRSKGVLWCMVIVASCTAFGCLRGGDNNNNSQTPQLDLFEDDESPQGVCGICYAPAQCDAQKGVCVNPGNACPTQFGPAGQVVALAVLTDPELSVGLCTDYDGDGSGDDGLFTFAEAVNPSLATTFAANAANVLLFEFFCMQDPENVPDFPLNLLFGTVKESVVTVDPNAFGANGLPQVAFSGASVAGWRLSGAADEISLDVPIMGVPMNLRLTQAKVFATIQPDSSQSDGIVAKEGILTGIVSKEVYLQALADLKCGGLNASPAAHTPNECCTQVQGNCTAVTVPAAGSCDALESAAKPPYCASLIMAGGMSEVAFYLHQHEDGTFSKQSAYLEGNAAPMCFAFELKAVATLNPPPADSCPPK